MLYKQMETHPQDSQQHLDARKKVQEFSISLQKKIHQNRVQQAQGQAQAQAQSQGQPPQNQTAAQPQAQGEPAAPNQNIPQQNRPVQGGLKPPEHIMNHINTFPYALPPQISPGTPEATKWLQEAKNKYGKALLAMENSSNHLKMLDAMVKERTEKGNPLNENEMKDYQTKKEQYQKNHVDAKRYSEGFRRQQEQQNAAMAASGQQNGMASQPAPQRPTMNLNQQAPNTGIPSSDSVNAAIQAARNSSINAGKPPTTGQPGQQNEQAPSGQGMNAISSNGQPIKVEGGTGQPQINTAIATAPHMQASMSRAQNSPHSAVPQSATSTGPPRPLTQQAALSQAARTYSSSQTSATPNVMGSHSHPSVARETPNINAVKMPISKQLPPGAIGTPQPVSMAPSRPTMSGGPNGAGSGVMGQPALAKPPGFTLVGDGERVMDKKKLDELVRQVTGGGEGLDSGEALTPEVEDVSRDFYHIFKHLPIPGRPTSWLSQLVTS